MALETGVVLKSSRNRCVVLTPQGEFRSIPRTPGPVSVGQEIQFAWPAPRTNPRLLLAAASLIVVLLAGTLFTSIFPAAGYVSVDINPSIELGINAWGRVVRAQGQNGDGTDLLRSLPLYGRPLDQALDSIARQAVTMHFLKPGNTGNLMVVTYTPGTLTLAQKRREKAYDSLAQELNADRTPVRLLFADVTPAQRDQAGKMGLSAGKYLVLERLTRKGVRISPQDMARTSIAKLLVADKLQLNTIMGPNTTYREVLPNGNGLPGKTLQRAVPKYVQPVPPRRRTKPARKRVLIWRQRLNKKTKAGAQVPADTRNPEGTLGQPVGEKMPPPGIRPGAGPVTGPLSPTHP